MYRMIRGRTAHWLAMFALTMIIGLAVACAGARSLQSYAVGVWQCQVTDIGTVDLDGARQPDQDIPAPFDQLPDNLDTTPYLYPNLVGGDRHDHQTGVSISAFVSVFEHGMFHAALTSGYGGADVSGGWEVADGLATVRFTGEGERAQLYATDARHGEADAVLLGYDDSKLELSQLQLEWADESISFTLNDDQFAYETRCTKTSDEPMNPTP